jgi:hypothetical protein
MLAPALPLLRFEMPELIPDSTVLQKGDRVNLIISASHPPFITSEITDVRDAIDKADIPIHTVGGENLEASNLISTLSWFSVVIELDASMGVTQLKAICERYIDDYLLILWGVSVREVHTTNESITDIVANLTTVPTSTTISLVAVAIVAVVIFILVK